MGKVVNIVIGCIVVICIILCIYFILGIKKFRMNSIIESDYNITQKDIPKLRGVSQDRFQNNNLYYGIQTNDNFVIINKSSNQITKLEDLFPTFYGNVVDFIVVNGKFMIFSDKNRVYSNIPNTTLSYSENIFDKWLFLPLTGILAVDYKKSDLSSFALPNSNILLTFYDSNNIYTEQGCVSVNAGWNDPNTNAPHKTNSCSNTSTSWNRPNFSILAINDNKVYCDNGNMYDLQGNNIGEWETTLTYNKESFVFNVFNSPKPKNINFKLLAVDNEDTIPYFITNEAGISYIVTPLNQKIKMSTIIKNNLDKLAVYDFTKLSNIENDYLIACYDNNLYNPYFDNNKISLDKVEKFMTNKNSKAVLCGLTRVVSYRKATMICFFYDDGSWYFIDYDPNSRQFLKLDDEFNYNNVKQSWKDWPSMKNSSNKNMTGISYYNWSIYTKKTKIPFEGKTTPWITELKESGLGDWKNLNLNDMYGLKDGKPAYIGYASVSKQLIPNFVTISQHRMRNDNFLIQKKYWLTFDQAKAYIGVVNASILVYDKKLKTAFYYSSGFKNDCITDTDCDTYISETFYPIFNNSFRIKHIPTNKYLYYDFVQNSSPSLKLATGDNWFGNVPNTTDDIPSSIKQSLGGVWGFGGGLSNTCLKNLNPSLNGTPYLNGKTVLDDKCAGNWQITRQGSITDGDKCLFVNTNGDISFVNKNKDCNGMWTVEKLPCDDKLVCGSSELIQKCGDDSDCLQNCMGPLFASQC
jgi:hypothetical protein